MPRRSRIDAAGALHHIMVRGIERVAVFRSDTDRDQFLERLGEILQDTETICYAWALIPNHFHLLLRTGPVAISTVMSRLDPMIERVKSRLDPMIGDPNRKFTGEELAVSERRIIETFGTYAWENLPQEVSEWDVLLLGQHYRLPTRLLDWTSSPYVALFFATENTHKLEKDGIVWCVSRVETNSVLPSPFKEYSKDTFGHMFLLKTLRDKFKGLKEFDEQPTDALIWFEPPSRSPRMVNQYAFFSVMPGVETLQCAWLEKYPEWHWGVPVPASLKPEVRRRLQVMNITERTIYTGLEGIARWLRAYYSP